MIPEEKEMVEKYKNQPFALIGVDSDGDRSVLQKDMKDNGITWRMFAGGKTDGPIATAWSVRAWPTIYVIDKQGIIRYSSEGSGKQAEVIANLLAAK